MLIHRPPENGAGEHLWEGLIKAKEDGLTKDIGVSHYSTDLIDALIDAAGEVPVVNQIKWSPFGRSGARARGPEQDRHPGLLAAHPHAPPRR
jgi:2,5-diketo-D-gluconate reductase A